MQEEQNNLLVSLHKWAERQDENFTPDAFAHLLRRLVEYDFKLARDILGTVTGGWLSFADQECDAFESTHKRRLKRGD